MTPVASRVLWRAVAAMVLVLPLLPIPRWTGAADREPVWRPHLESWVLGVIVVVVMSLVAGRFAAVRRVPMPRPRVLPDAWIVGGLGLALAIASAWVTRSVFVSNPQLIDEMAQLFHARIYAAGRFAAPPPVPPEAFLITHTWIADVGWISQYPPGQIVLFTLGLFVGAEWLVNPVLGGVGTVLVFVIARQFYGRRTALIAAFLWTVSAWVLTMSATYMNHVAATTFALAAWALLFTAPRAPRRALAAGAALGLVAATRPLDAVAAALSMGVWIVSRRDWRMIPRLALGGAPVALVWGLLNWRTFGSPLALGYSVLYGPEQQLGFHVDPWGHPFTPLTALSNLAVAVRRLHIYLYEWPIPALLPLGIWAALARHRRLGDLVVVAGLLAAPLLYFFYWHSGFYPGPRFYYIGAPMLVIGTARAWRWGRVVARSAASRFVRWDIALVAAATIVLLWGWAGVLPLRLRSYHEGFRTLKLHPERELAARGVDRALVLVRTSWANRLASGLWAVGIPPGTVERALRFLDACEVDGMLREFRSDAVAPSAATARLETRLREADERGDTVVAVPDWPDPTLRLDPARPLEDRCRREMQRDLAGLTVFASLGWRNAVTLDRGIVFARDLFERNGSLLERYEGWELWQFAPPPDDPNKPVLQYLGTVTRATP